MILGLRGARTTEEVQTKVGYLQAESGIDEAIGTLQLPVRTQVVMQVDHALEKKKRHNETKVSENGRMFEVPTNPCPDSFYVLIPTVIVFYAIFQTSVSSIDCPNEKLIIN